MESAEQARWHWPEDADPRVIEFVEGGRGDAPHRNAEAWSALRLVPHVLREAPDDGRGWEFGGRVFRAPIMVAPWGLQRLVHPDGETGTAAGAARAGVAMGLSSASTAPFAEVGVHGPFLMQLYLDDDRSRTADVISAAQDAGAMAVGLTVDNPPIAKPFEFRRGILDIMPPLAAHPGSTRRRTPPALNAAAIEWVIETADVPVLAKGVMNPEDAVWLLELGVTGIIVSNHGGRQLLGVQPTAQALPGVVDAVAGRAPVWVDSGIRTGYDVARALALGADAVLVGRLAARALAAGGASGVESAMRSLCDDFEVALRMLGCARPQDLGPQHIAPPG